MPKRKAPAKALPVRKVIDVQVLPKDHPVPNDFKGGVGVAFEMHIGSPVGFRRGEEPVTVMLPKFMLEIIDENAERMNADRAGVLHLWILQKCERLLLGRKR